MVCLIAYSLGRAISEGGFRDRLVFSIKNWFNRNPYFKLACHFNIALSLFTLFSNVLRGLFSLSAEYELWSHRHPHCVGSRPSSSVLSTSCLMWFSDQVCCGPFHFPKWSSSYWTWVFNRVIWPHCGNLGHWKTITMHFLILTCIFLSNVYT